MSPNMGEDPGGTLSAHTFTSGTWHTVCVCVRAVQPPIFNFFYCILVFISCIARNTFYFQTRSLIQVPAIIHGSIFIFCMFTWLRGEWGIERWGRDEDLCTHREERKGVLYVCANSSM